MKKLHLFVLPLLAAAAVPALAAVPIGANAPLRAVPAPEQVTFQIFLPLRNVAALKQFAAEQQTPSSPYYQKWITPLQYAKQFGPSPDSRAAVSSAAKAGGFTIDTAGAGARSISVTGTVAQINKFFQTTLKTVTMPNGKPMLVATTPLVMPPALAAQGAHVVSFARIPPRQPMARLTSPSVSKLPDNRNSSHGAYWYNDMKQAYDYPSYDSFLPGGARLDGTGVRAAVLMSDKLYPNDVAGFFNHENFTTHWEARPHRDHGVDRHRRIGRRARIVRSKPRRSADSRRSARVQRDACRYPEPV